MIKSPIETEAPRDTISNATRGETSTATPLRAPKFALLALFLVALIGGAWWKTHSASSAKNAASTTAAAADEEAPAPVLVEVSPATLRPMETLVAAQGLLAAGQGGSAQIASSAAGRISQILVRQGDHVIAGQLLATLDNRGALAAQRSAARRRRCKPRSRTRGRRI